MVTILCVVLLNTRCSCCLLVPVSKVGSTVAFCLGPGPQLLLSPSSIQVLVSIPSWVGLAYLDSCCWVYPLFMLCFAYGLYCLILCGYVLCYVYDHVYDHVVLLLWKILLCLIWLFRGICIGMGLSLKSLK